eukprot:1547554-Lingulodinium_polyedra.AAC.1
MLARANGAVKRITTTPNGPKQRRTPPSTTTPSRPTRTAASSPTGRAMCPRTRRRSPGSSRCEGPGRSNDARLLAR